ncbi:MAG: metallophosphoesterase family protein [Planctomycetes bacterium]|nr:metallophosphoesterase family protein [Planctomycetota bacterium]
MLQAIISDVHANLEAFTAVLDDIKMRLKDAVTEIISLGDLVGYGPEPVECIQLAIDNRIINLWGNHELALFKDKTNFNPIAQRAIDWTKGTVKKAAADPKVKQFFNTLKHEYTLDAIPPQGRDFAAAQHIICSHGSPRGVIDEYVIRKDDLFKLTPEVKKSLNENFMAVKEIGFVGHTHIPYICTSDFYLIHPEWQGYEPYPLLMDTKTIVNAGAVGQPRDGDHRACYMTFDGQNIVHYRVEYPVDKTVAKMQKIPELDKVLWTRLMKGL